VKEKQMESDWGMDFQMLIQKHLRVELKGWLTHSDFHFPKEIRLPRR
jgi:hypothetical protein